MLNGYESAIIQSHSTQTHLLEEQEEVQLEEPMVVVVVVVVVVCNPLPQRLWLSIGASSVPVPSVVRMRWFTLFIGTCS